MNIDKLQSELQHVPDQALIGYVQNPTGQVPSYLALAELTRRKEIRGAGAQQPQAAKPSIAQQVVQESQPGVASLPIRDDMYQEQSMAAGGIVAFKNNKDQPVHLGMPGSYQLSDPDIADPSYDYRKSKSYQDFIKSINPNAMVPYDQYSAAVKDKMALPAVDPASIINQNTMPRRNIVPLDYNAKPAIPVSDVPPMAPPKPSPAGDGITTGYKDLKYKSYSVDEEGFNALMPADRSMRDYAADYRAELGEDPNRAALKDRLAKMQATSDKETEQAPWMALAKAGLGMAAGKSQFALQNIASGGIEGLKDFAEAKDNLKKAEERRFELESRVAQAERAEQLASLNYGAESKRTDDASRRAIGLAKQSDKARAQEVNAKQEYDAIKDKYSFQQKDHEINLMSQRLDKQISSAESQSLRYELQNKRDSLKAALSDINERIKTEQASVQPDANKIAGLQQKFDSAYNALYALAMNPKGEAPTGGKKVPLDSFNLK